MLFLIFEVGGDRYALEASRIVEVLPLVAIKKLPQAPKGIAGVFLYHGEAVPAVDVSELTFGTPCAERLSTRILLTDYVDATGKAQRVGLIVEKATELTRQDPSAFISTGIRVKAAPYLGPVLPDPHGPIQLIYEEHLIEEPVQRLVTAQDDRGKVGSRL